MYTQCPDCRTAFRVTAVVLQQAAGRVRCGHCGQAFNALERLSESAPEDSVSRSGDGNHPNVDDFDVLSATDNVRIEDTGVEWQVIADEEPANAAPQESLELVTPGAEEERYDDNTPLPGVLDDDDDETAQAPAPPRRRAEDFLEPRSPEFDERQADLALSEPEDWTDLLAEVGNEAEASATTHEGADGDRPPDDDTVSDLELLDADLEPTGEHAALELDEPTLADDDEPLDAGDEPGLAVSEQPADDEPAGAGEAGAEGEPAALDDPPAVIERTTGSAGGAAPASNGHHVPPPSEEEITLNRLIDQDLLRLSQEEQALLETGSRRNTPAGAPPLFETIIMEGERVQSSLETDDPGAEAPAAANTDEATRDVLDPDDRYARARESTRRAQGAGRYATAAGVAALALLLGAQVVHTYRETLATYGGFGDSLMTFYEAMGAPITPAWNVNGWLFQDTRGSTDTADRVLTISSTLTNASPHALPYPLLNVALTDRYEEVVARQLLEAGQYLEIRAANGRVAAGGRLEANVTIAPLPPQADGFSLNVCYPLSAAEVRCATGAFRDR